MAVSHSEFLGKTVSVIQSQQRKLTFLLEAFLVIALMYLLSGVIWQFLNKSDESLVQSPQVLSTAVASGQNQTLYRELSDFHFFGKTVTNKPEPVVVEKDIREIPRSTLPLKLAGLLAHPNPERALAIIESRGKQGSYRLGETIESHRAEITAIKPDRVIVTVNGKEQALMLYPEQKTSTVFQPKAVAETPATNKRLKTLVEKARQSGNITDLISISPVRKEGELIGYRLNPSKYPELFKQAGLQRGDVAVSANGKDLTDPLESLELLNNLATLQRVDLTVEREGMLYQVELSL
ncbi:type II secretion system protein GspC [Endozoicomonas sp. OPT23]|uniref:type II secretion system protein GspC n=1 Tax=Endozoicomonas sp. OPT23 TaxID=2072845 RepID=UPI00129A3A75|nr:type II secretion system protein GspC [Endozoicomonas sp. OPT23]MRI32225.1 type II secretion system protein GspC [Endozoicomonas sp. OPT23]